MVSVNKVYSFVETTSEKDKQAVVVFGANWCPDCQILAGLIKIAQEDQLIQKSFFVSVGPLEQFLSVQQGFDSLDTSLLQIPLLLVYLSQKLFQQKSTLYLQIPFQVGKLSDLKWYL